MFTQDAFVLRCISFEALKLYSYQGSEQADTDMLAATEQTVQVTVAQLCERLEV